MSSPFCIVVGDTGGEDMPKEILYVYIFNSVEPKVFRLHLWGFLLAPSAPSGAVGAPPLRAAPLRVGGFFLCSLFLCFSLVSRALG